MLNIEEAYNKNFDKLNKKLPKPVNKFFIKMLQKLFHEKTFNEIFEKNHYLTGLDFDDSMLELLNITYTVKPNEVKNIPSSGRLLIIANHITGASDAFSLVQLIAANRENQKVKFMVNGMLMGMHQANELLIPVDNITGSITKKSFQAINEALQREEAVIIFPAGIVDRLTLRGIKDAPWKPSFLKIAKRNNTPILPIKINGRNSVVFYLASMILPKKFSGLLLPREFATTSRRKPLHFNIGRVIPLHSFSDKSITIDAYLKLFYEHIYTLGTNKEEILKTQTTIAAPQSVRLVRAEIQLAENLGETKDGKKIVLVSDATKAPNIIRELGRLRELSFRAVGGGTGKSCDNDPYDTYYKHLILWDASECEIVGAYRLADAKEIIEAKGISGLYTNTLCGYTEHFNDYKDNAAELGRSFVQPKYWGSRALDNLWQGVGRYLAYNPNIRYTFGTVTISAETPPKASAAIVYFYSHYFSTDKKIMNAKTPYIMTNENKIEFETLFHGLVYKEAFVVLKKYLKELNTMIPTLFKQYAELYDANAVKFFEFSVNKSLHGVIEAFIIADNSKMKESKRSRYIKI
jgi:putative hemolysin